MIYDNLNIINEFQDLTDVITNGGVLTATDDNGIAIALPHSLNPVRPIFSIISGSAIKFSGDFQYKTINTSIIADELTTNEILIIGEKLIIVKQDNSIHEFIVSSIASPIDTSSVTAGEVPLRVYRIGNDVSFIDDVSTNFPAIEDLSQRVYDVADNLLIHSSDPFGDGSLIAKYELNTDGKDTVGGYDGVVGGGLTFVMDPVRNKVAKFVHGTDMRIDTTLKMSMLNGTFSMSFFAKKNDLTKRDYVWNEAEQTANSYGLYLTLPYGGFSARYYEHRSGSMNEIKIYDLSTIGIDATKWNHYCVTRVNGQYMKIYVNGNLIGTSTSQPNVTQPSTFNGIIGSWKGFSGGYDPTFNGELDQFEIYNRPLTDEEVKFISIQSQNDIHIIKNYNDLHIKAGTSNIELKVNLDIKNNIMKKFQFELSDKFLLTTRFNDNQPTVVVGFNDHKNIKKVFFNDNLVFQYQHKTIIYNISNIAKSFIMLINADASSGALISGGKGSNGIANNVSNKGITLTEIIDLEADFEFQNISASSVADILATSSEIQDGDNLIIVKDDNSIHEVVASGVTGTSPYSMDTSAVTQGEIPSKVYVVDVQPSFAINGGYIDVVTLDDNYSFSNTIDSLDPFGDSSLIAKYQFEDNLDDLLGNFNGVNTGITFVPSLSGYGKAGKFSMSEYSDIDNLGNSLAYGNDDRAFSFLARLDAQSGNYNHILCYGRGWANNQLFGIAAKANTLRVNLWGIEIDTGYDMSGKPMQLYTISMIGGVMKLYVVGIEQASIAVSLNTANRGNKVCIGAFVGTHSDKWNGELDQIEFYNRGLTAEEALQLENNLSLKTTRTYQPVIDNTGSTTISPKVTFKNIRDKMTRMKFTIS